MGTSDPFSSVQDYIDAVDRLLSLNLTEVQQREVVRVILHCLGSEKAYNPFYTLILARLLTSSSTQATHSYQITLQYALWDHFRALGESDVGGAEMVKSAAAGTGPPDEKKNRNIAKAYAWWCAKAGLGLTILKVSLTLLLLSGGSHADAEYTSAPLVPLAAACIEKLPLALPRLSLSLYADCITPAGHSGFRYSCVRAGPCSTGDNLYAASNEQSGAGAGCCVVPR